MTSLDVQRYLAHLGQPAPQATTSEALGDLTRAHVRRVPFENLQRRRDATASRSVA